MKLISLLILVLLFYEITSAYNITAYLYDKSDLNFNVHRTINNITVIYNSPKIDTKYSSTISIIISYESFGYRTIDSIINVFDVRNEDYNKLKYDFYCEYDRSNSYIYKYLDINLDASTTYYDNKNHSLTVYLTYDSSSYYSSYLNLSIKVYTPFPQTYTVLILLGILLLILIIFVVCFFEGKCQCCIDCCRNCFAKQYKLGDSHDVLLSPGPSEEKVNEGYIKPIEVQNDALKRSFAKEKTKVIGQAEPVMEAYGNV